MDYQGIFFDFDYTLGDSTQAIVEGYRQGFASLGLAEPTVEQVRTTVGMTLMEGYTLLTGDQDEEHRQAFRHKFHTTVGTLARGPGRALMIEGTRLLPGAVELLQALKAAGVHTAIVSTKPGDTLRRIFDHQGCSDLLDLILGGDDVSCVKPDPEGLWLAMERLGLRSEQVLFCGDTVIDAATAQAGGCGFCAVLNGTTKAPAFVPFPCVHIAQDLYDLKNWLKM